LSSQNNLFRRAAAFNGQNKCNVFALDIAWRSGFRVPIINIATAANPLYSYPRANTLTTYAERAYQSADPGLSGFDRTQWGFVATQVLDTVVHNLIAQDYMLILVYWRRSGIGHVGIIRRIVNKTHDNTGRITDVEYEGWEASSGQGARIVGPRTDSRRWRTGQCNIGQCGQAYPRHADLWRVFCAIHIVGLLPETGAPRRGVLNGTFNACRLRG
jgi:hypothetical protein